MKKTLFVAVMAALPVFAQAEMPKTKDIPVPAPGMEQPRHWGAAGEMPGRPSREDMQKKMLEKFDADKDGQLSDAEKEAMLKFLFLFCSIRDPNRQMSIVTL